MADEQILVVEDNEKNMKLVRDVLVATGYRTLEAGTGHQAIALAAEHAPDLVLMDIQLPDIDGVTHSVASVQTSARRPSQCSRSPRKRCTETASGSLRQASTGTSRSR